MVCSGYPENLLKVHGTYSRQAHPRLLYTKDCQHRPFKHRRSHEMPSLLHTAALRTLRTDMTTHCFTLLPSRFKHGHDQLQFHTAALARQQKRSPFNAQDRQGNQLASFQCPLMSRNFIVKSNARLNGADQTTLTTTAISTAN